MIDKVLCRGYIAVKTFLKRESAMGQELTFFDCEMPDANLFPVENFLADQKADNRKQRISFSAVGSLGKKGVYLEEAPKLWREFIDGSKIPEGYRYAGFSYGGYIGDCCSWCLPSWIWTNAALVRYYVGIGRLEPAIRLGELFLKEQNPDGSWLVRYDYSESGIIEVDAPNDSAYIANQAMLSLYESTREEKYLKAAESCAEWIISTARPDSLVWFGRDHKTGNWITNKNIVDIGFTAGLFAELYRITNESRYLDFARRFTGKYIDVFFNESAGMFCTGINAMDKQLGGFFARGQAWALEGLMPAYELLKDERLKNVINRTIDNVLAHQSAAGGWPYNFGRHWMGIDCKGTTVIAYDLMQWQHYSDPEKIYSSVQKALQWAAKNTLADSSEARGGIFCFSYEGAVVHHMNTETAFVYGSSYALEAYNLWRNLTNG